MYKILRHFFSLRICILNLSLFSQRVMRGQNQVSVPRRLKSISWESVCSQGRNQTFIWNYCFYYQGTCSLDSTSNFLQLCGLFQRFPWKLTLFVALTRFQENKCWRKTLITVQLSLVTTPLDLNRLYLNTHGK